MKKKLTILDAISIPSPCPAEWDSMTGSRRRRFCGECNRTVYNLSAMTRDEAEALIARFAGRLCARVERDAAGVMLTEALPAAPQLISRRASPVAAALVTVLLGLSGNVAAAPSGAAAGAAIHAVSDRSNNAPQPQGGAATLSGVLKDSQGQVIPGAKVTLINQASGEPYSTATSDDEGSFSFPSLAEGTYIIKVEAPGFMTLQLADKEIRAGQSARVDLVLEVGRISTSGVVVMAPQPLRALHHESDLIVIARVGRSVTVKAAESNEMIKTTLEITSVVKGKSRRSRLAVYNWGWGDDKQFPGGLKAGDAALFFLKKRDDGDGFEVGDYSYGVKKLAPADLSVYLSRIEELNAISQAEKPDAAALVEWLVRCAEQRATRWEGAFDLARSAERDDDEDAAEPPDQEEAAAGATSAVNENAVEPASPPATQTATAEAACSKPDGETHFAAMLSDQQKERLKAALFNIDALTAADLPLVQLVQPWKDERLVPFLLEQLRRDAANPPRLAESIIGAVTDVLNDQDVKAMAEEYKDNVSYADLDAEDQANNDGAEAAEVNPSAEEAKDIFTARRQRSEMLQRFITLVEKKRADPPRGHARAGK